MALVLSGVKRRLKLIGTQERDLVDLWGGSQRLPQEREPVEADRRAAQRLNEDGAFVSEPLSLYDLKVSGAVRSKVDELGLETVGDFITIPSNRLGKPKGSSFYEIQKIANYVRETCGFQKSQKPAPATQCLMIKNAAAKIINYRQNNPQRRPVTSALLTD